MKSKTKSSKKPVFMPIEKHSYMTSEDIQNKLKEGFVFMSEEQCQYLQHTREIKPRLCCQTEFLVGSIINQPESTKYQYKFYNYPFEKEKKQIILKTIVSFLNTEGGYIFIGIKETPDKKRIVSGLILCQAEKQQIYKDIRALITSIKPDVSIERKVSTFFVPVKANKGEYYLSGRYLIKIEVAQGNPQQLYYTKNEKGCLYYHRYHDQCVAIPKEKREREAERRKTLSKDIFYVHKCIQPEIGKPIYQSQNTMSQFYNANIVWKNHKLSIAYVFSIDLENLKHLRQLLKPNKVKFDMIVLGPKQEKGTMVRMEISKSIENFESIIQSYGGVFIRKEQNDNKSEETTLTTGKMPVQAEVRKTNSFNTSKKVLEIIDVDQNPKQTEEVTHTQDSDLYVIEGWEFEQNNKESSRLNKKKLQSKLVNQELNVYQPLGEWLYQLIPITQRKRSSKKDDINGNPLKSFDFVSSLIPLSPVKRIPDMDY